MKKTHIAGVMAFAFVLFFLTTQPLLAGDTASNPYPTDEDTNGASPDIVVSWTAGDNAAATDGHGVYWGTDHDAVNNATTESDEYMGAQTATTYDPAGSLTAGVTYYWRIDELNPEVSPYVWKGDVWSFIVWDGSGQGDFSNGYATWVTDSVDQVRRTATDTYTSSPSASVKLARREKESFQLCLRTMSGHRLDNVRLETAALTKGGDSISTDDIDWYVVGYVTSPENSTYAPDVLLPCTDFDADTDATYSIYVTIDAPSDQVAGTYTGTFTLKTDSGLDTSLSVEAEIYDITLPAGPANFVSCFDFNRDAKSWEAGEFRAYGDFLLDNRLNMDNLWLHTTPTVADTVYFYRSGAGLNSFNIRKVGYGWDMTNAETFLDALALEGDGAAIRALAKFFGYDEIGEASYEGMRDCFKDLEEDEDFVDIEAMTTAHIYADWNLLIDDPLADMAYYYVDEIQAARGYYDFEVSEVVRDGGYKYWGYNGVLSIPGNTNYIARSIGWQAFQQKMDGYLYYSITEWHDPLTEVDGADGPDNVNFDYSGFGRSTANLVYPGVNETPIGSKRLADVTDGIEEYEYLVQIAAKIDDVEVGRELAELVVTAANDNADSITDIHDAKDVIADWITRDYLAKSPTPGHRATVTSELSQLSWSESSVDVDTFDVYFGETLEELLNADTDSDSFMTNQAGTTYSVSDLADDTTFYWRIDEVVDSTPYKGYVWKFSNRYGVGLLGWWRMDEDSGSTIEDSSDAGNDGELTGATRVTGMLDGAVEFEGNGSISIPAIALSGLDDRVTVTLWVYGNQYRQPCLDYAFEATDGSGNTVISAMIPDASGTVQWTAGYSGGADESSVAVSKYQYRGTWNHWAFSKNADTGYMKIYLNGECIDTTSSKTNTFTEATLFRIGAQADDTDQYWGIIDDFRVFDLTLSDAEIQDIYDVAPYEGGRNLVGWWRFDETEGTVARDTSDFEADGIIYGATPCDGQVGGAFSFDGSDDYVSLPSYAGLSTCDDAFTVSLWVNGDVDTQPADDYAWHIRGEGFDPLAERSTTGIQSRGRIPAADGDVEFHFGDLAGGANQAERVWTDSVASEWEGQWNHYVFTWDGPTKAYRIIVNGSTEQSGSGTMVYLPEDITTGVIGAGNPSANFYAGAIDEFRVYNYAMTTTEAAALYDQECDTFVGLIGLWRFDESSDSTAEDTSEYDNDGTVTGAAWVTGQKGNALEFDGSDVVTIAESALDGIVEQQAVTVAFWQYGDAADQPQYDFVFSALDSTNASPVCSIQVPSSDAIVYFDGGRTAATSYDSASKSTTAASEYEGQWNHWAFTKDVRLGIMRMYLNGSQWGTDFTGKTGIFETVDVFCIGAKGDQTSPYDGKIDDVRVYNRALNADEVNVVYSAHPPLPDPMTFATVPYVSGASSISMVATTATDPDGVEYYFECTSGGGNDSGWQASTTYTDTGLSDGTYTYRVKARDTSVVNWEGEYSGIESCTLDATAPTPNPMTFATAPYASAVTSLTMVASTATDVSGVEYYFTCTGGGGNDSDWQDSTTYTDTGLSEDTEYTYTVTARDKSPNQNTGTASDGASATTGVTLLSEDFETNFDNWTDGGVTDWAFAGGQYISGVQSAVCFETDTYLTSDNLDTSGYSYIRIVVWYRDDQIDNDDDVYLQLYDGTNYDNRKELGVTAPEYTWHEYDTTFANSSPTDEYFHANFRIRFDGSSIDTGEHLWVEDVVITAW